MYSNWNGPPIIRGEVPHNVKITTIQKIVSLLVFSAVFATTAFAQITFDQPTTGRNKNHRGSEKHPRKAKHRKR